MAELANLSRKNSQVIISFDREPPKNNSMEELVEKGYNIFRNGVTPEIKEYLRTTKLDPYDSYEKAIHFINRTFKKIQTEDIFYPASFLDFGAGEGHSLIMLHRHLDFNIFSEICLYDVKKTNLESLKGMNPEKKKIVTQTTTKPETRFDFINMFFVAGLDFNSISEAANLTKQGKYMLVFDYNITSTNEGHIRELCSTELEQALIQQDGLDSFLKRATQYTLNDYKKEFSNHGLEIYSEQEIGEKFCVLVGQKN